MPRSSWIRDTGSVLIETVVIGSMVFLVVIAGLSAAIDISRAGDDARQLVRSAAVHAARHAGPESARELAPAALVTTGDDGAIRVAMTRTLELHHPDGISTVELFVRVAVPVAPYRSDRG